MASTETFDSSDWIMSVSEIPITLPPPGIPVGDTDKPSDDDMGVNDPSSIIYVGLKAKNIPEKFNSRIKDLEKMLDLTHQWLDIHAGIQTKKRKAEGKLPTDSSDESAWKRSDYRVKVVDALLSENCAWVYNPSKETYNKYISVKKASFHLEILKDMLLGLALPTGIQSKLEQGFKALSDLIIKTQKTAENRAVWTLFHVFTYDEARDDFRASLRNISYRLDQQMLNVVVGKSSYEQIEVTFKFTQADYNFGETIWIQTMPEIEKFIKDIAASQVHDPIQDEIPVD
ncbi:hypothetical protein SLS62_009661 [Diatrype stigma]|uniref:Uncharacterized protein n=1 Tax=Diatrype stigma TaxID=117547 RepID=A0AAN9UCN4_9PEZI